MNRFESADQAAFFDAMHTGAARAEAQAGHEDLHYSIAGHHVCLRIAGAELGARLPSAFTHLARPLGGEPALTIHAWDDVSTGATLPRLVARYLDFAAMHCFDYLGPRNEIIDFNGDRIRAVMHLDPMIVSLFDRQSSTALYWTPDAKRIPVWDWGTPLRIIFNEWARLHGLFLVHSGAVGRAEGGVLFAGKSGSGKSTSALACLDDSALSYAGDDYCLLSTTDPPHVYSLYSSAKLKNEADFERFPHLLPLVSNRDRIGHQKALIFLGETYRAKVTAGFPLRAILVPQITGSVDTTIGPCTSIGALRALAPSTLLQLPGNGRQTLEDLATLVRQVPAYALNAGTRMNGISRCVEDLLNELCGIS